ncbi:MAG: hypothetical protein FWF59_07245 [Turicibacter sp.]|nr:hypothetical protein [Turicibacter sp.]
MQVKISQIYKDAWTVYTKNFGRVMVGLWLIVTYVLLLVLVRQPWLWYLGTFLVFTVLFSGVQWFYLDLHDNKEKNWKLFDSWKHYLKMTGSQFYMAIFTALWSLLLVVPGIVKGLAYSQATYLLKEYPEIGVFEAITLSRKMMKGKMGKFFVVSAIPVLITAAILVANVVYLMDGGSPTVSLVISLVTLVVLVPYSWLLNSVFYRHAIENSNLSWFFEHSEHNWGTCKECGAPCNQQVCPFCGHTHTKIPQRTPFYEKKWFWLPVMASLLFWFTYSTHNFQANLSGLMLEPFTIENVSQSGPDRVSIENFSRLFIGMTQREAEEILGESDEYHQGISRMTWREEGSSFGNWRDIQILFEDGFAISASFQHQRLNNSRLVDDRLFFQVGLGMERDEVISLFSGNPAFERASLLPNNKILLDQSWLDPTSGSHRTVAFLNNAVVDFGEVDVFAIMLDNGVVPAIIPASSEKNSHQTPIPDGELIPSEVFGLIQLGMSRDQVIDSLKIMPDEMGEDAVFGFMQWHNSRGETLRIGTENQLVTSVWKLFNVLPSNISSESVSQLRTGQSVQEVMGIMGVPHQSEGLTNNWEGEGSVQGFSFHGFDRDVHVDFVDGRLTNYFVFENYVFSSPATFTSDNSRQENFVAGQSSCMVLDVPGCVNIMFYNSWFTREFPLLNSAEFWLEFENYQLIQQLFFMHPNTNDYLPRLQEIEELYATYQQGVISFESFLQTARNIIE